MVLKKHFPTVFIGIPRNQRRNRNVHCKANLALRATRWEKGVGHYQRMRMQMPKKVSRNWCGLVLTLIVVVECFVIQGSAGAKIKPIVVGCPVPRASAYGQNGERGLLLAAEEINASGGVNVGGIMRPLKLEIIDTRDEEPSVPTSELLLAIEKLILREKADVIVGGPCMSECGIASMDLFARYQIPDIVSIGCYTPTWDEKNSRQTLRNTAIRFVPAAV